MDTYTIAAAQLVGAPKGKLYEAIRTGLRQPILAQASTSALTVYNARHAHPYRWTYTGGAARARYAIQPYPAPATSGTGVF